MRGVAHPVELKAKALALRGQGRSLLEISVELGIPKNTVQGWVGQVVLTDAQRARLCRKELESRARGRELAVLAWQRKIAAWKKGIENQVEYLGSLPFDQPQIGRLACGLLYICEGGKYPSARQLTFGNSDPRLIQTFLLLLRKYFTIEERKFRIAVLRRWDQNAAELARFWSGITGIPLAQFYHSHADRRTKGIPTLRRNYYGVCYVRYLNTTLQYTLQAIGESVLGHEGEKKWWSSGGSNPGPPRCHRGALPAELLPPKLAG